MFIPIAHEELAAIDGTVQLTDRKAHRVTPELLSSLGYTPGQQEDAEYAALVLASVAALAAYGERLVLVAEVEASLVRSGDNPANGDCLVAQVAPEAMTCWFSEAPASTFPPPQQPAQGLDVDTAWGFEEVQGLLHESDLLWNDVEEYRRGLR